MNRSPSAEEKLDAVIRAARTILEKHSFTEAARAIFDQCREMTGAVSGYVALLSEDGQENEVLFLEAGGMPCSVDPDLPMPIRGLRAVSYQEVRGVYDNAFAESEYVKFMPEGHVKLENVMFAPLIIEGKAVGLLGLSNKNGGFTDRDAKMATAFGELAAIALTNSRLLESLEEKNSDLQKFNDAMIDREMRILEIKEEVNTMCEELGRKPIYPSARNGSSSEKDWE